MNSLTLYLFRTLGLLVKSSTNFSSIIGPANIFIPRSNVAGHGLSNSSLVMSSMKDESVVVTLVLKVSLSMELILPGDARGGSLLPATRGVLSIACCSISFLFMVDVLPLQYEFEYAKCQSSLIQLWYVLSSLHQL